MRGWTNRRNNELGDNLEAIDASDAAQIRQRLLHLGNIDQSRHLFNELAVGAALASLGLQPRYEHSFDGKKGDRPDWYLTRTRRTAIVEVRTIDPAQTTRTLKGKTIAFLKERTKELYDALREKAQKYAQLVEGYDLPYVIAVCPDIAASLNRAECEEALTHASYGIFNLAPQLSGCIWFEDQNLYYRSNPFARRPWRLREASKVKAKIR